MSACRNAIEFNSLPSMRSIVPGGYDNMKLLVTLGVPEKYKKNVDVDKVLTVFPYSKKATVKVPEDDSTCNRHSRSSL